MHTRQTSNQVSLGVVVALVFGLAASVGVSALSAEEEILPLRLGAIAANIGARGPQGMTRVDIDITRWSTEEERAVLLEALKDPASRSLPDALRDQEQAGRFRQIQGMGHELRYARMIPAEDGGMVIILATDRRIAFGEAARNTRSLDNNVSLIELTLDAEGNGEGQLLVGAEMVWREKKNQLTIESLSSEPVRLNEVRRRN